MTATQLKQLEDQLWTATYQYRANSKLTATETLLSRYDLFIRQKMLTHITTNLSADEIEQTYGNRVRSRLREMVNIIAFPAAAGDKRV